MIHICGWKLRDALRVDSTEYGFARGRAFIYILFLHNFGINVLYRLSHVLHRMGHPILAQLCKALLLLVWSADVSPRACLGPGLTIAHSSGIVIGGEVIAGDRCSLFSSVVIGGRARIDPDRGSMPRLGDNVMVCTSAAVLGPITVGSNCIIGAHAIVIEDVPNGTTVAGIWRADKNSLPDPDYRAPSR